jgi:hypothetical protein
MVVKETLVENMNSTFAAPPSIPHIIRGGCVVRIGAFVRIAQFKLFTITVGIYNISIIISWWIPSTVGYGGPEGHFQIAL